MRNLFIACLCLVGAVRGQVVPPPEVAASAIAAVEDLGKQVLLGRHKVAIERMYPRWKERMAKRVGGMDALEKQLEGIGEMMARQGVAVLSFRHTGVPIAYEVWPGKAPEGAPPVYQKWLLLVPTETEYRITQPGTPPTFHTIRSKGFQVAVSEKGKNEWTFIDGSGLSVADLRSLFITLPENMELPPVERKAVEAK